MVERNGESKPTLQARHAQEYSSRYTGLMFQRSMQGHCPIWKSACVFEHQLGVARLRAILESLLRLLNMLRFADMDRNQMLCFGWGQDPRWIFFIFIFAADPGTAKHSRPFLCFA